MDVHFPPDMERKINDLAAQSGRGADELVRDAMAGYLMELGETQEMLNSRYDDLKSGKVKPIDGQKFFEHLRRCEDDLINKPSPE